MRVEETRDRLVFRDSPGLFWAFYLLFPIAGMAVLYMAWTDSPDRLTYVIATIIGLSHLTGGAYMLWKEPASEVKLDIPSGRLEIRRWGLFGRQRQGLPLASIEKAEIEVAEHGEGDEIYRPALLLRSGERLPSSMFWYQTETRCSEIVNRLNQFLLSRRHLIPPCRQD